MSYVLPSIFLHPLKTIYAEKYLDPARILAKVGLPPATLSNPDLQIDQVKFVALLNETAKMANDPLIGFTMGKRLTINEIGPFGLLLSRQNSLMNVYPVINYFFNAHNRGARHTLLIKGASAFHQMNFLFEKEVDCDQITLLTLTGYHNIFKQILGEQWQLRHVHVKTSTTIKSPALQSHFNCQILNNQQINALEFSVDLLNQPIETSINSTHKFKQDITDLLYNFDDIEGIIITFIDHYLPQGQANKDTIANALGVHPKVLQKCLSQRGLCFSQILAGRKQQLAQDKLKSSNIPIHEIALDLGYSDSRAFSRAFANWTNTTPLKWRKQYRE